MTRLRRDLPALIAVLGLAALATAPAGAAPVKRHHVARHPSVAQVRRAPASNFPVYVDHGSDYNPGSDNLYFSDTKVPRYIVGPAWFQRWDN